jgi:L-seryl-tRNA(Ser) seleniumtransferase
VREGIPTLRMLTESAQDLRPRAEALLGELEAAIRPEQARCELVPETSRAGGGALPMCDIPTFAVRLQPLAASAQECARFLEQERRVPVIARIHGEALLFDVRTLLDDSEVGEVAAACAAFFAGREK